MSQVGYHITIFALTSPLTQIKAQANLRQMCSLRRLLLGTVQTEPELAQD